MKRITMLMCVLFLMGGSVYAQQNDPRGGEGSQNQRGSQQGGHRQGPPPEAYKACEGKSVGATAQFVSPRGETLIGTCDQEGSQLVLRPNSNKGGRQGQSNE